MHGGEGGIAPGAEEQPRSRKPAGLRRGSHDVLRGIGSAQAARRGPGVATSSPQAPEAPWAPPVPFNQALLGNSCQAQKICMCPSGTSRTILWWHPETPEDLGLCKLQVVTRLVADVLDKG